MRDLDVTAPGTDELTAAALAADPDAPVPPDAPSLWELIGTDGPGDDTRLGPLPDWYMPAAAGGAPLLTGWRRQVVFTIVAAFLAIAASGLCNTYGDLRLF